MKIRNVLALSVGVIASIFLLVFLIVVFIFASEAGTQRSLQLAHRFLPQLSFENQSGSWLRGMHFDAVRWRDADVDIELTDVNLRLRSYALLYGQIKLLPLNAQTLHLQITSDNSEKPVTLPRLLLPFSLAAPELALQQLIITNAGENVILEKIHTAARWTGTTLRLTNTQLQWQDIRLRADGKLSFYRDYPLQLNGELHVPQIADPIAISADGDLRQLRLHTKTTRPAALQADIQLATLDPHLPLKIDATLLQPAAINSAVDAIIVHSGDIHLHGDLTRINGDVQLALNEIYYGDSSVHATVQWQPGQLLAQTQWRAGSSELLADCHVATDETLPWRCNGEAKTISLEPWLSGQNAVISSAITASGHRNANAHNTNSRNDGEFALQLALSDLHGNVRQDVITGQLSVNTEDGQLWQVPQLTLQAGPNQIKAKGYFGSSYQLQVELNAGDLSHLHQQLSGSVAAKLSIEGDGETPSLRGQLRARELRYDDFYFAQINGEWAIINLGRDISRARIDVTGFRNAEHAALDAALSLSGKREQQRLALTLRQNNHRAQLQCDVNANRDFNDWKIDCPDFQGRVSSDGHNSTWNAATPLRGHLQWKKNEFEVSPFCLRADSAELCLDEMLRYSNAQLAPFSAHAKDFPLQWASVWFPENIQLEDNQKEHNTVAALQLKFKSAAPLQLSAALQIPHSRWHWDILNKKQSADVNDIEFDLQLEEKRATFSGGAHSPTIGDISTHFVVDNPQTSRELEGNIALQKIDLAGLAWLVDGLDSISGQFDGAIRVTGTAAAPQLHGQLLLQNGTVNWPALGAPFQNVHVDVNFDNNRAKIGGWFVLGQGGGDIDGDVVWDYPNNTWSAQLGLVAGGISATPLPQSSVVFSPHINASAKPGELHTGGYVDIARAEFFLKELPPETIDVSQDAQIVGQKIPADKWKIWTDVALNLGEQFHFRGLGADVDLTGRLRLQQEPGDVAHLTGEVRVPKGRYRAYGQRLSVRSGSFIFYGPTDNPDLNLEAVRDMPPGVSDVVGLRVIGSLKTPEAILFSEPSMPDSDIAYYLLTGHKPVSSTATNQFSASGALLSLGLSGSEDRAAQLAEKFGIKGLQLGTAEGTNGTEAELSGQLSQDLSVRYGHGISQRSNSISFQYRLTPKLVIETISGLEDSLDLLYSFSVK